MKLSITKLLALMAAFLMILQVLPTITYAESLVVEEPIEESPAVMPEEITDNEPPAEETSDLSEEQEVLNETPADAESTDEPEVIAVLDEGSAPEDAPVSEIGDETEQMATEDITDESLDITEDAEPSSGDEQAHDVQPEDASLDEIPDAVAVDDQGEIDYEAIEAEYGMEFDDIYESFPELTPQEEVDLLYDGSWIKQAIYNEEHAYVKIKHDTEIYSDSDLADEDVICLISDCDTLLLATEHCQRWNTISVHVWLMTPDMEMIDGYIFEKDLVNTAYPDEDAFRLADNRDHGELIVGQLTLPVFAADVSFPEPDEEIPQTESDVKEEKETVVEEIMESSSIEEAEPELIDDSETEPETKPETAEAPVLRGTLLKMSSSATGLSDGQSVKVYRGDDLQKYVRAKDGTATTATYRHYVTLTQNGTTKNFDALCLNAKRSSSTSGFTASLINGKDYNPLGTTLTAAQKAKADGMFWILLETNFSDPFDTAISQWAVWKYGGGTDYDSNVAKVSNIAAGKGFQYNTTTMRSKINALINGATNFVANGGVPTTTITASASAVSQTPDGHHQATVWLDSNGTRCRIAKSQLSQSTVTGYSDEDNSYYYFDPAASFTVDFAADELSFDVDAWTRYDQYEYWVGNVSSSSRQDMGFIVYTGGIGDSASLSLKATKPYGDIRIMKQDADTGLPLPGVVFEILDSDLNIVECITTDENGQAISGSLDTGTYTVREVSAPEGYQPSDTQKQVTVRPGQTENLTFTNALIRFRIEIIKTDSLTHQPLPGAVFTVVRKSGLPSHGDEDVDQIVAVLVTDEGGRAVSDLLTWGEYEVKETTVPDGYLDEGYTATAKIN